jgi:two-component sensor histidine kinase
LVHPDDGPRVNAVLQDHLEGRTESYETEHRMRHKSGTWVWVLDKGRVTERDEQGRPLRVSGTHLDITGRINEQRRTHELLEQTERDARTKSELLREVNHRVTNNLTSVLGLLVHEADQLSPADRDQVVPVLDRLQQRLRSLLQVHQMLSRSAWAPVSLDQLVGEVVQGVVGAVPGFSSGALAIEMGGLRVSPRQAGSLALILNELATNTVKHTGGDAAGLAIRVSAGREGEWITLTYQDNGPGFPAEVLENRRSNVGLKLLREIVTHTLRGEIQLVNAEGAKTTIRMRVEEENRT